MKNKKKTVIIIVLSVILLIVVIFGVYTLLSMFGNSNTEIPDVVDNEVVEPVKDTGNKETADKDDKEENQTVIDRTPKFDDYENRLIDSYSGVTEDGFIVSSGSEDSSEELAESISNIVMPTEYSSYNNYNDFSNGFITIPTDNIGAYDGPFTDVTQLVGKDGSEISVTEYNPIGNTVDSIREYILDHMGLSLYMFNLPTGLTGNENWELGVGLENYHDYFEGYSDYDPTMSQYYQVIADTTISTKFGDGLYFVVYDQIRQRYVGHAIISCNRDRILYVDCASKEYSYVRPYIEETIDSCVIMVE